MFEKEYEINVFGTAALSEAMLPLLEKSYFPRIANVSSTLGSIEFQLTPDTGFPVEFLMVRISARWFLTHTDQCRNGLGLQLLEVGRQLDHRTLLAQAQEAARPCRRRLPGLQRNSGYRLQRGCSGPGHRRGWCRQDDHCCSRLCVQDRHVLERQGRGSEVVEGALLLYRMYYWK
jgi:hypothetical protein